METKIKAILYDLDGVLVDACEWHYQALNRALREIAGTEIDRAEHTTSFNGLPTRKKLEQLVLFGRVRSIDVEKIFQTKQAYTIDTINEMARPDPEKIELHKYVCHQLGIPIACVTNSIRETAVAMLEKTDQLRYMSLLITNEDVTHPKPRAEGYIQAMVRLGVTPDRTLIIEDSPVGTEAAFASCANYTIVRGYDVVTKKLVARSLELHV